MPEIGYVARKEVEAARALDEAEAALVKVPTQAAKRQAEQRIAEAADEHYRIQTARLRALPVHGNRFVKCTSCNRPFNDEGSFLAHWEFNPYNGRIGCVFTESILMQKGFVVDEHPGLPHSLYVIRHPKHEIK